MGFSSKYYVEAEIEIARRKAANEAKLEKRKQEIIKKIPEYENLRFRLSGTGIKLSNLFFGAEKPENFERKLKDLEKETRNIQTRIKELLTYHGYGKDYLDEIYSCDKCEDSGIFENCRCSCFMDVVKRIAAEAINSSSPIKLSSFSVFDISLYPDKKIETKTMAELAKYNFEFCKNFADNFHLPSSGILMRGSTGLGKTHLSLSIANVVIEKGYSVIYGSAPDLLRKMEKERFNFESAEETLDLIQHVDLLILDDLGAEFLNQVVQTLLYNIINTRINAGLPTIINTNLTLQEITGKYGERLSSRLFTFDILTFYGNDIRLMKKFGNRK